MYQSTPSRSDPTQSSTRNTQSSAGSAKNLKRSEYQKKYYRNNKAKCRETSNRWLARNREKMRQYYREYNRTKRNPEDSRRRWRENREHNLRRAKLYQKAHRAELLLYWKEYNSKRRDKRKSQAMERGKELRDGHRKWCAKNRDKRNASAKRYRETHQPLVKSARKRRRARVKNAKTDLKGLVVLETIVASKKRARCYYCKSLFNSKEAHLDHVIALASGGDHSTSNLCVSCPTCNLRKKDKRPSDLHFTKQPCLNL